MKYRPDLASGPWPCYVIDFDELVALSASQGVAVESDGKPVEPKPEAVDRMLKALDKISTCVVQVGKDGKKNCYRAEVKVDGVTMAHSHHDDRASAEAANARMADAYRRTR